MLIGGYNDKVREYYKDINEKVDNTKALDSVNLK